MKRRPTSPDMNPIENLCSIIEIDVQEIRNIPATTSRKNKTAANNIKVETIENLIKSMDGNFNS